MHMTDQEINEAVSRRLFNDPPMQHIHRDLPDYCHSIAAAWEIVDWVAEKGYEPVIMHSPREKWGVNFLEAPGDPPETGYSVNAKTAPMAICLAFLKLKE